ncbi:MAG: hypothetical protein R3A50_03365 [Saprospiraceae bacterium]
MITNILIRPAARGGKYLGPDAAKSNISAKVAILDQKTRSTVTEGYIDTSSKDAGPSNLMDPVSRAQPFATDPNTIGVTLQVDIDIPTTFIIQVTGPYSYIDQARTTETEITVLPGVDIGQNAYSTNALMPAYPEGLVIEIPGLCISHVSADYNSSTISATAKVTMMCGCKIEAAQPGWPWPPRDFTIQLVTYMSSGAVYKYELHYDTNQNMESCFTGQWNSQAAADDTVKQAWIFASEPKLGNQGSYIIYPR